MRRSGASRLQLNLGHCSSPHPIDDDKEMGGPNKGTEEARGGEVALIESRLFVGVQSKGQASHGHYVGWGAVRAKSISHPGGGP